MKTTSENTSIESATKPAVRIHRKHLFPLIFLLVRTLLDEFHMFCSKPDTAYHRNINANF